MLQDVMSRYIGPHGTLDLNFIDPRHNAQADKHMQSRAENLTSVDELEKLSVSLTAEGQEMKYRPRQWRRLFKPVSISLSGAF